MRGSQDEALLVTSGAMDSSTGPTSYRNICSAEASHVHALASDYRGYRLSSGVPTEPGPFLDAPAVVNLAGLSLRSCAIEQCDLSNPY
ncbi:hypothetical protein F5Y16DRAFT_400954 [Xylariaceae sp. FL0255]|nr:hypothetical protein F5Y16DRAFT_400954 [Xylariaceae sp. FL0255]